MHKAELTASTHDRLYVLFFLGEVTSVSVRFRFHFRCSSRFDTLQFRLHNDYFFVTAHIEMVIFYSTHDVLNNYLL